VVTYVTNAELAELSAVADRLGKPLSGVKREALLRFLERTA